MRQKESEFQPRKTVCAGRNDAGSAEMEDSNVAGTQNRREKRSKTGAVKRGWIFWGWKASQYTQMF